MFLNDVFNVGKEMELRLIIHLCYFPKNIEG